MLLRLMKISDKVINLVWQSNTPVSCVSKMEAVNLSWF